MSYALSGDAIKYTGRSNMIFSTSSTINVTDVYGIIDDIAAEIDAMLPTLDIQLPIDESAQPKAYAILKTLNSLGAAAYIELRLFGEASPGDAKNARFEALLDEYHRMFDKIQEGDLLLTDATGATMSDSDLASSGSYRGADGRVVEPFFKRLDVY